MATEQAPLSDENDYTDVVIPSSTTTTVEYGVRDWGGEILTMPEWTSPADAVAAMHKHGYTAYTRADVLARTTTTTVTETGWEAAS